MIETREMGRTNVYADLGYADAAGMQRKAMLAQEIIRHIEAQRLTQGAVAVLLGTDEAEIFKITHGQFRAVSETKLLKLVAKLGDHRCQCTRQKDHV